MFTHVAAVPPKKVVLKVFFGCPTQLLFGLCTSWLLFAPFTAKSKIDVSSLQFHPDQIELHLEYQSSTAAGEYRAFSAWIIIHFYHSTKTQLLA